MLWAAPVWAERKGTYTVRVPSKPARAFAFTELEGKNTLISAVLPGRVQDRSQGLQFHVRARDPQEASVHNKASAETAE